MYQSLQTSACALLFVCGVDMSGILWCGYVWNLYFYGFIFHQGLLYENKVLPYNLMYASRVLDVVM
jgi:hypothetical protein